MYNEIHKKCKPIFIEDVVQNEAGWRRFEYWYHNKCEKTEEDEEEKE